MSQICGDFAVSEIEDNASLCRQKVSITGKNYCSVDWCFFGNYALISRYRIISFSPWIPLCTSRKRRNDDGMFIWSMVLTIMKKSPFQTM
jgi:hypothetical protein